MRKVISFLFALSLVGCGPTWVGARNVASLPRPTPDEAGILEAVLTDPQLFQAWGMSDAPVLVDQTRLAADAASHPPDVHFYSFSQSQNISIDPALPALLAQSGGRHISLRAVRLSPPLSLLPSLWYAGLFRHGPDTGWERFKRRYPNTQRVVSVSAPAISEHRALVAIERWSAAPCCGDGYSVYLERTAGVWRVVGYGGLWSA